MTTNTKYVLGFMFTPDFRHVLLIEKKRPDWQRGKLNGIGGHIEGNEAPVEAIVREFREETGVETTPKEWQHYCDMRLPDALVHVFAGVTTPHEFMKASTKTDEEVVSCLAGGLAIPQRGLPNLRWLVPMALDSLRPDNKYKIEAAVDFINPLEESN